LRGQVYPCEGRGASNLGLDRFLRDIYLECKPWLPQTIEELDHGVNVAQQMLQIYEDCKHKIKDPEKAAELEKLLKHGLASLQLNRAYVIGFLRYFPVQRATDRAE